MSSSLSNKFVNCNSCLDYIKIKNEKLLLKCFNCNTYYKKKFNKDLIKKFKDTYSFCNNDLKIHIIAKKRRLSI